MMKFELFMAHRYLARRRKTAAICMLGLCIGVLALIVVRAVFTGFQSDLKTTMVSVHPHLKIEKWGGMDHVEEERRQVLQMNIPGLTHVAGFVAQEAVIKSEMNATGAILRGIDTAHEDLALYQKKTVDGRLDFTDFSSRETRRRFLFFKKTEEKITGAIILGDYLARALHVETGDIVTVIAPTFEAGLNPLSLKQAESRTFVVRGIFHLGMNEFDSTYALISLSQAQQLFRLGERVNGLSLRFSDVDGALEWKWFLQGEFGSRYVVSSWHDINPTFFQAVRVEKSVQTIFLGLIVLVAVFNIFSTLIMIVMEKTKDMGILRALGATRGSIRRIFLLQGLTIGISGVFLGIVSGLTILHYRNEILAFIKQTTGFELFPSDVYLFDGLPAEIHAQDVISISLFCLLASLAAAFYPAHRASRLQPVEALRYE